MAEERENSGDGPSPMAGLLPVLLHGVWRFRVLVVLSVGVGTAVGVFRGVVIPNQYQSVGKLFVKPGIRDTASLETGFAGGSTTARISGIREAVQNEMQVLNSSTLFDKIVKHVGADNLLAPYDPAALNTDGASWYTSWFHAFQSWWFSTAASPPSTDFPVDFNQLASLVLRATVFIQPEPGTSVISFSYVSHSPERAKVVVDAALQAAIELHSEVFTTMESLAKVEGELKVAEQQVTEAERLLRELRLGKQVYDFEAQRSSEIANLAEATRKHDAATIEIKSKQSQLLKLTEVLKDTPTEKILAGSQSVSLHPEYQALVAQQAQLRGELERLDLDHAKGKVIDPTYSDTKKTVEALLLSVETRLKQIPMTQVLKGEPEANPYHEQIAQRMADIAVVIKGLESDVAAYEAQRKTIQERLGAIEALSPELRRCEIDVAQKRSTADTLLQEVTRQRAVQRLDQANLSSVTVMHPGSFEVNKVAPQRGKLVFYGLFGGAFVGFAIAALFTLLDRRIRVRADLVRLGLPDDGVVSGNANPVVVNDSTALPPSLAGIRDDVAHFWTTIPYERRDKAGLRIAFVPCGDGANVGRAAASLAIGLAAHGGEKVLYVATVEGSTWLAQRLGITPPVGWSEVVRGERPIEAATVMTPIAGLSYLGAGTVGAALPHPMAGPAFVALLDRLAASYRFVILELPDLEKMTEGRSVLGVVDAAELVVCRETSTKRSVRAAMAMVKASGARLLGGFLQARKGGEIARLPSPKAKPKTPAPGS